MGTAPDLRVKLLWLSIFRVVATSLLLALLAIRLLSSPRPELSGEDSASFFIIGGVYLMTLVYALLLRRGTVGELAAWGQLLGDVLVATSLVYLTGGAESPFAFTYLLAIVAGAILLYQRGAFVTAAASAAAFVLLVIALQSGWIRMPPGASVLGISRLSFVLISNLLAQFLIAALAGYLSRQLLAAGGRLSEKESDFRQLANFQRQILAAMPSGLVTCTPEGTISFANRAAEGILGLEPQAWGGRSIEEVLPGVREFSPLTRRNTLEVDTARGRLTLGLTTSPMEAPTGALLIVFQDLTEVRRLEEELKRVDRLAAVGRLAAQLAHEIRNPLAAMRGAAQMLSSAPSEATAPRLSGILVRESDRLSNLLEDFLRFARPPAPNLRDCALKEVVLDTVEMLQGDPLAQQVRLETDVRDVVATADPDQLRQVLINLIRNALAAAAPDGAVRVTVNDAGGVPEIRIWDSAGSIPSGDLARVFEPFYTTREGGTGLGLSTAHSIVRGQGGTIQVTSSKAHGTEFAVRLPPAKEVLVANSGR